MWKHRVRSKIYMDKFVDNIMSFSTLLTFFVENDLYTVYKQLFHKVVVDNEPKLSVRRNTFLYVRTKIYPNINFKKF